MHKAPLGSSLRPASPSTVLTRRHSQNSRLSMTDTPPHSPGASLSHPLHPGGLPLHTQPHICVQQTAFSMAHFRCQHKSRSPSSHRVPVIRLGITKAYNCPLLWLKSALKPRARLVHPGRRTERAGHTLRTEQQVHARAAHSTGQSSPGLSFVP